MSDTPIIIAGAKRTPIGSFQGQFKGVHAATLGSTAMRAAIDQAGISADLVSEVIMGCVLPAGLGQAPARQASLGADIPLAAGCTTINKVCGSGMKAAMLGHDLIKAGSAEVVVAGGMESMTEAPYLLPKARAGYRMGHGEILDHMFFDGLQNPYDKQMMGHFAESCAEKYTFTREEQDNFSIESINRAIAAMETQFVDELAPVTVKTRKGEHVVAQDQEPPSCNIEKLTTLRPAFARDGSVTAATSSKISDGAAAVVLMTGSTAQQHNVEPLATIVGHATHAHEPEWFTTAPVGAMQKLLKKVGWDKDSVDLFEINEAFAVVTMAAIRELDLDHTKVNVNGGAVALGHPIGCTGTRIIVTLINALKQRNLKRGVASLCIGGGEATAIAIEIT